MSRIAIEFDKTSIVFGEAPQKALPLMDQGATRDRIKAETGQILGVHDCALTVREGEILVLMGLSGSGKSTLLRAVNGLNPILRGDVRLRFGDEMVSLASASEAQLTALRRQAVAMVFQQFGLLPWRTVAENVGLGLELAGVPKPERAARIAHELAMVQLSDWADRKVEELSGGMQQRVGLARAFATQAPILLMDEPFSALDPLIRAKLQDELLGLQKRLKRTILFVSHDLEEAFRIGNRIALMEGGRIVQIGTAREIWRNPANAHVAEFVSHLDPFAVLTAADAAQAGLQGEGPPLDAATPLRLALARVTAQEAPVPVSGPEGALGALTRDSVLAALTRA